MKEALQRAHRVNTYNMLHRVSSGLSLGYLESFGIDPAGLIISKSGVIDIALYRQAAADFYNNYQVSKSLVRRMMDECCSERYHSTIEIILYSAFSIHEKYKLVSRLNKTYSGIITNRALYVQYLLKSQIVNHHVDINHTYWNPYNLLISDDNVEQIYGPFYGLSFGHPCFILDSLLAKNNVKTERIRFFRAPDKYNALNTDSLISALKVRGGGLAGYNIIGFDYSPDISEKIINGDTLAHYSALSKLGSDSGNMGNVISLSKDQLFKTCSEVRTKSIFNIHEVSRHISEKTRNILAAEQPIVVLHTRDSQYSYGSSLRDVDINTYIPCIKMLLERGFAVVRISKAGDNMAYKHRYLYDFSDIGFTEMTYMDQLQIMMKARFIIGTSSGISHWATYLGVPLLMINCTALPANTITDSTVHSPKRLLQLEQGCEDLLRVYLSDTLSGHHLGYAKLRALNEDEIVQEVKWFMRVLERSDDAVAVTFHELVQQYSGKKPLLPDYFVSEMSAEFIFRLFNKYGTRL